MRAESPACARASSAAWMALCATEPTGQRFM